MDRYSLSCGRSIRGAPYHEVTIAEVLRVCQYRDGDGRFPGGLREPAIATSLADVGMFRMY